jgi:predicted ATPase
MMVTARSKLSEKSSCRNWLDADRVPDREAYPFCLPLLEGIAALAGYNGAGGKGYGTVDHSNAIEVMGGDLAEALRAAWLPRITKGWFFRAESFFSVARYLDEVGSPSADFLSHSHGEGFMRFFEERCQRQGIYIFDEPESALSPARQIEFLRLLRMMDRSERCQVIMATHSPLLMAYPNATLLLLTKYGLEPTAVRDTVHFRTLREFFEDPKGFVEAAIEE